MSETVTFGVFLWTDRDGTGEYAEKTNKLQLGHRDDPTEMPDEWESYKSENVDSEYDDVFGSLMNVAYRVIKNESRYGSLDELETVESGYYRKLGEITFDAGGEYARYRDSPPSYEDTDGENLVHLKPKYANWRQLAV